MKRIHVINYSMLKGYLLALAFGISITSFSQNILVKRDKTDTKQVTIHNYSTGNDFSYISDLDVVSDLKVSSTGLLIGFIEIGDGGFNQILPHRLTITNDRGEMVFQRDSVLEFAWHPLGNKITFLKGTKYEGRRFGEPTELIVFDLANNQIYAEIDLASYIPLQLKWIVNDNENVIYFRSRDIDTQWGIVRFDITTNSFQKTDLPSHNISPDGLYYAVSEYEASEFGECPEEVSHDDLKTCFGIYEIASNKKIEEFSNPTLGEPYGWVFGTGHSFMFQRYDDPIKGKRTAGNGKLSGLVTVGYNSANNEIYDVQSGQIVQSFEGMVYSPGSLTKWLSSPDLIVAEKSGTSKNAQVSIDELLIIKESDEN